MHEAHTGLIIVFLNAGKTGREQSGGIKDSGDYQAATVNNPTL
jgi:hypothetical protein